MQTLSTTFTPSYDVPLAEPAGGSGIVLRMDELAAGETEPLRALVSSYRTWIADRGGEVDGLPPEFLRKGRFDEIFFLDLPTDTERRDIWKLHLDKRLANSPAGGLPVTPDLLEKLSRVTEGFAGAPESWMIWRATAPDTAITAPTDRSMPRVAMTSVIPSATSMSGALLRRMSMSGP